MYQNTEPIEPTGFLAVDVHPISLIEPITCSAPFTAPKSP